MAYITYYLNGSSLSNATSIFTDIGLTTLAANGYYSNGAVSRQQVGGVLQAANVCPSCVPDVPCDESTTSGGIGVTEYTITLDIAGGCIAFDCNGQGIPDKFEIIHNGVKVATTGMTVANGGPFDNVYGDPTVPTLSQTLTVDQFIGTSSSIAGGVIPSRVVAFQAETGSSAVSTFQQFIWWVYDLADYTASSSATLRVTGPSGTDWDFIRRCT
jgi:hypothetical protein